MLFCLPLFDINTFEAGDEALLTEGGLKMVHNMLVGLYRLNSVDP